MIGSHESWRALFVPAALVAFVIAWAVWAREPEPDPPPPPPPIAVTPPAPIAVAPPAPVAVAPSPPPPSEPATPVVDDDVRARPEWIPAIGACERPSAEQIATLRKTITRWAARSDPQWRILGDEPLWVTVGCLEEGAIVVDAGADFTRLDAGGPRLGRTWVLRVSGEHVDVLASKEGSAQQDWMEWADEGVVRTALLVDLDADHRLDPLMEHVEHEGGAVHSPTTLTASLSHSGTTSTILKDRDRIEVLASDPPVIAFGGVESDLTYRCLGDHLKLRRCAAADRAAHADPPPATEP